MAELSLREMISRGEVGPETLVWRDGMLQWASAGRVSPGWFSGAGAAAPASAPPTIPSGYTPPPEGDATGGIIPYKNPAALFAYYLGIFSLLPIFLIGLVAMGLGIMALKQRARRPEIRGAVHAWIGIIVGGFFGVLWLVLTVMVIVASVANP